MFNVVFYKNVSKPEIDEVKSPYLQTLKNGSYMFYSYDFESFNGDLSNLTDGSGMFYYSYIESFNGDLSNLINGSFMFRSCDLKSFDSDLSKLVDGEFMFAGCWQLSHFNSDLSNLVNGSYMFYECESLTDFDYNLSKLVNGEFMFDYCPNLNSFHLFNSDLSSLSNGENMFQDSCTGITTFTSDLSNLTNGINMLSFCSALTSFTSDLHKLTDGCCMFEDCSSLTTFISDLSSLIDGGYMFEGTKLSPQSVMYIAETINDITAEKQLYIDGTIPYVTLSEDDVYSATRGFMSDGNYVYTYNTPQPTTTNMDVSYVGRLTLGIDVTNNANTIQQQLEDFAKEATYDSWEELKQVFIDKGWTVTWQYNGTDTSTTYDLRNREQITPYPIFAKLEEVFIPSEEEIKQAKKNKERISKPHYKYTSQDGTKFYNIRWYHDSNVTNDEYTLFNSLEDAAVAYGVFLKENIISTEE